MRASRYNSAPARSNSVAETVVDISSIRSHKVHTEAGARGAKQCKEAGLNARMCKDAGFSVTDLKIARYSAAECKSAGFEMCKDCSGQGCWGQYQLCLSCSGGGLLNWSIAEHHQP